MIEICGRKIKVATGSKSQTINICTKENVHGIYEFVIQFTPPFLDQSAITHRQYKSVDQLVRSLCDENGGILERQLIETAKDLKLGLLGKIRDHSRRTRASKECDKEFFREDWNGKPIALLKSTGGVLAVADPFNNLVIPSNCSWPPIEIVKKLHKSNHQLAFSKTGPLGYYTDLQSLNSEDALTWSVFGPVLYATEVVRRQWVSELMKRLKIESNLNSTPHLWLWQRIPHPDTLVPGGPEIDFGIQTDRAVIFGEAKWKSKVACGQGKQKDKDQIVLRREFFEKYGENVFPNHSEFVVLGISKNGNMLTDSDAQMGEKNLRLRDLTWDQVCQIESHPYFEEVNRYLDWKKDLSL
jgi:hypothetical protein